MIVYSYMDGTVCKSSTWIGVPREARRVAMDALPEARSLGDQQGDDSAYHAVEGDGTKWYRVSDDGMIKLGAGLLDGHSMSSLYSIWCSETGTGPMTVEECIEAGIDVHK